MNAGPLATAAPPVLRVATRIADVDAAHWDALVAGRSFAEHRALCLAESVTRDAEARYVLAERAGRLVGAAVWSVDRFANPRAYERSAIARHIAAWLRPLLPILSCEVPIALLPGIFFTPPEDDRAAVTPSIVAAIARLAAAERAVSIRVQHLATDDALRGPLAGAGYRAVRQLPNARLDVAWRTREAYEAWLPHRRRSEVRRIGRRAAEHGVSVRLAGPGEDGDPALRRMVGAVVRRHAPRDPWVADLLPRARAILGDDLGLLVARRGGRAIGCLAVLRSGEEMLLKWPGLDHPTARGRFAYHALLAASVEHAIASGVRRLWLGPTTYAVKRDLGAELEPRTQFVLERGRVVHWLARRAARANRGEDAAAAAPGGTP